MRWSASSGARHAKDPEAGGPAAVSSAYAAQSSAHDCFLTFCRFINVATGLAALLCAVACGMALAVGGPFTVSSV